MQPCLHDNDSKWFGFFLDSSGTGEESIEEDILTHQSPIPKSPIPADDIIYCTNTSSTTTTLKM